MRVLLVEDNALTRFTIKSLLDKIGHEVVGEAEDAAEALECFKRLKPDVVFLDLILPGKSGVEILGELRAVDPDAKIVVVTAVEQDEIDRRLADKGVNAILRKPFSYEDFKTLMKDLA
ncbi:MAG: response regulator [Elusimicrobia bacterium]|jgi:two-component system chemotaxis response regulator CheY|nr:response regulator [Elusimicrobiota bacterium]